MSSFHATRSRLACMAFLVAAVLSWPPASAAADNGFKVISHFSRESIPRSPLVQAADGSFYGTTRAGGEFHKGEVFRIAPSGERSVLYSFRTIGRGGEAPSAGLAWGSNGKLYGTTFVGGRSDDGMVFSIRPDGKFKVLHEFTLLVDGASPDSVLVLASDGNFYGTTANGVSNFCCGTVYRLTAAGNYELVHDLSASLLANHPSDLIEGRDGWLYGTTALGGAYNRGTIFRVSKGGTLERLHSFGETTEHPYSPRAGLLEAADGNFYGTTFYGGSSDDGAVFRMTPAGQVSVMHSFAGFPSEGANPAHALTQARNGNIYGTTYNGGSSRSTGTIFRMSPDGSVATLHAFDRPDGTHPCSTLLEAADGLLYGMTDAGGKPGDGTLYRIKPN